MDRVTTKKKMPEISPETKSNLAKWVPLICAGAALGVGIIALKEIKNINSELRVIKNNNCSQTSNKKLEQLEEQINFISEYINEKKKAKKQKCPPPELPSKTTFVKEEPLKDLNVIEKEINIINEDEYEEVEVTDDEC